MRNELESVFSLPVWIAKWIENKIGRGVKGVISYVVFYLLVTGFLSIMTDGIGSSFINQMFYILNTYLLLGMCYVFLYYWKKPKKQS
ncbi:hypothetical protein LCL96_16580 [Rossellomorea aquimaris]|uniref:hypothetical protein n=1 Tax=Rossellomorea aquimaris TaxID=189382 RepID=UPI001CD36F27|nr:hypothetical protein [Rossellomorea aquimaris]MCA1060553.1 hypothetical protein [Rossellomorea aquimaris]